MSFLQRFNQQNCSFEIEHERVELKKDIPYSLDMQLEYVLDKV
jgi:hypothetical protein